jgi:chromosome segregation ATPase
MLEETMADESVRTTVVQEGPPIWVVLVMVLLGVVALAGVWTGWKGLSYAQDSRQGLSRDIQMMKQGYATDLESLQQRLAQTEKANADLAGDFSAVTKRLRITRGELKKAHDETQQVRDEENQQLAAMGTQVKDQLATKATTDDVKAVSGEVSGVRTDLDTTKKDLQMARSEMGTLIAKNHDDIETLRRLGERDYIEFTLEGKGKSQKVGDITVELRSADPKRNQCNIALVVDDKRTEKRNRTVNEPIFVYAHGARQPMEVVINQVEKNKVGGYLSVPRVKQQTTTSSSGG